MIRLLLRRRRRRRRHRWTAAATAAAARRRGLRCGVGADRRRQRRFEAVEVRPAGATGKPELVSDDESYQSGCGATAPVVVLVLLRPQRRGARGDRERDVGRVEILAGRRSRSGSRPSRWPACGGIRLPATTIGVRCRCAGCPRRRPRTRAENGEERRERQAPTWWSGSPSGRSRTPSGWKRDRVGGADPQFLLALDHQAVVERPLLHGLGHVGLGLAQLLAGLDGLLGLELGAAGP